MRSESVSEEINRMIADVGLPHKRTALAKDLSGIREMPPFVFPCKISMEERSSTAADIFFLDILQ